MRKNLSFLVLFLSFFLSFGDIYAATPTIHSIPGYGNWSDPLSWSEGRVPTSSDIVEINSTMNLDTSPTVAGITVSTGSTLSGPYYSIAVSGDIENYGVWGVVSLNILGSGEKIISGSNPFNSSLVLNSDIAMNSSISIGGNTDFNNHSIEIATGKILTIKGQITGTGIFNGDDISLNTYGDMSSTNISGENLHVNVYGITTHIADTNIASKNITLYSGATLTNFPNGYYGYSDLRLNVTTESFHIASGATIDLHTGYDRDIINVYGSIFNDGKLQGGEGTINLYGNIENNGIWVIRNTNFTGNGINSITGSNPINSSIVLLANVLFNSSFTFNQDINFNNHSIEIATGKILTIKGQITGTGIFNGDDISLNTYGDMSSANISGENLHVNINGIIIHLANTNILGKSITINSGVTLTNFPNGNCGYSDLRLNITTDLFHIASGAIIDMHTGCYYDSINVYGNLVNDGKLQGGNLHISGNLQNNGIWNAPTYASWPTAAGATEYTIQFDPGTSTGFTTNSTSYNITDKISGSYYWQVEPDNSGPYARKCINMSGCTSSGVATPVLTTPSPTNLTQQVQSPGLGRESIRSGEKVGKYQSGSGIILSVSGNTIESSRLIVEIYTARSNTPTQFSSGYTTDSTKELILPHLGAGDYRWRARIETQSGAMSSWVDYGTDSTEEIDYVLYEGFEPYPYGYKFANNEPAVGMLSGGISKTFWTRERSKIDGNKWIIFNKVFPESRFKDKNAMFDAFEEDGWIDDTVFQGGSCFGMAVSSATQYAYSSVLKESFQDFSTKIGTGTIWDKIDELHTNSDGKWDEYNETLETILEFQIMQKDSGITQKRLNYTGALNVYDILEKHPSKIYVLSFRGTEKGGFFTKDTVFGHAVIPYKVESFPEGKRIYIWDNNVPYKKVKSNSSYDQYIEIDNNGNWKIPFYKDLKSFDKMSLVSLDYIYTGGEKSAPIGFNSHDMLATLTGQSDFIITDSVGRISGFSGGIVMENIPGIHVIVPLNATLTGSPDNTRKQIYLPQKLPGLTIKVSGKTTEPYDLMIAGGDYYTKVAGVTTSTGQLDNYQVTGTGISIDFDNQKTGNYSLLTDNFQDSLTGTIFLSGITATPSPQQISYDWNKVIHKKSDAVLYQVDTNSDGIYDLSSNYSPVPTSPNSTGSISGYVKGNTNATMAGWKVILQKQEDPSCKENKKKDDKEDNHKNKGKENKCRDDEDYKNNKDREDSDHNREIFAITDKKGYYTFMSLSLGTYSVSIESQKNWAILKPQNNIYNINLMGGQNIIDLNFETNFLKGKNK